MHRSRSSGPARSGSSRTPCVNRGRPAPGSRRMVGDARHLAYGEEGGPWHLRTPGPPAGSYGPAKAALATRSWRPCSTSSSFICVTHPAATVKPRRRRQEGPLRQ